MPDLMKTPSNRRYVVNFQQKEPLNKYDIWLSFNKHNLDGNIVIDSEYLSDKDLVFKVFVDGRWVPILGIPVSYEGIVQAIEELDKKKMNIVPNFVNGHIPVFLQGTDECDQLVDGGTIEELVANALTTIINNGGTIPIQRATTTVLGGVKAGLHTPNNNPDQYVEAKFKFPEGYDEGGIVENDRLYISASEIVNAINSLPGGSGLDLQLMGPTTRGGARANYVPVTWDAAHYIPVLVRTVDEMLYVNIDGIIEKIVALLESGGVEIYEAGEGIDITENVISNTQATDTSTGGVKVDDWTQNAVIKNLGVEVYYGNNSLVDAVTREIIDTEHLCITQEQLWALLNYTDEYTGPMFRDGFGIYAQAHHEYNSYTGVYDDFWTFNLKHSNPSDWGKILKLKDDGSEIEWIPIPGGGQSYTPLNSSSTPGQDYVITAPQSHSGYLKWDGTFDNPPAGDSFAFTWKLSTGTKIADYVLNNVAGSLYAPNSVYTAGVGIEITNNNTINSVIEKDNNSYEATSSLVFNCVYASAQHPSGGISMIPDNTPSSGTTLDPYTYTEVTIKMVGLTAIDVRFNTATQLSFMKGDPVYVMFDLAGKNTQINISVPSADDKNWLINVNNAVITNNGNSCLNITNYSRFLCTLQFGTVKIEPLEATYSVNDDNNSQEEP